MRGPLTSPNSLDRAYRALVHTMAEARTSPTDQDLLERVCQAAVAEFGFTMAWVGVAEHDPERRVRPVAQAGFEAGYLAKANISWADVERGRGPTGTAIREGRPVVCRTLAADPGFAPWWSEASVRNYASSAALPLMVDGNAWGALNLYCADGDAFADDEMALLEEMSAELAFIIEHRRSLARQAELTEELRRSATPDAMAVTAAQTAHDLNNLLTVITLSASQLKESASSPDELAGHADAIEDAASRATALARHLLAASRRQVMAVDGAVALDGFLRDLTPILQRLAGDVAVVVEGGAPGVMVAISRTALEQITINLLVNARDAMHGGGVAEVQTSIVEMEGSQHMAKGAYARLSVRDTGAGIPPEVRARVFEPFFTTKGAHGTGLGLACVADQVRRAGGSVDIASSSAGTTVTVCLPLA